MIGGNISARSLERFKTHTIALCTQAMWNDYFDKRPSKPIYVYLFADDASYRSYSRKLFKHRPSTPYGYYLADQRALIMNIATGGGTLVHEMTHALIEPDWPDVPAWFNEGLGSLHEQCGVHRGSIKGFVNWRLPILHRAMAKNTYVPLSKLISTTKSQFYGRNSGVQYAEARYLCLYLQYKNVLHKFYKQYRDNFKDDPTGEKALVKLLGKPLEDIEKDWQAWVMRLRWGR